MDESQDDNKDSDEERLTFPVDIVTPDSHKALVWTHFGFHKDALTGRVVAGSKAICKISKKGSGMLWQSYQFNKPSACSSSCQVQGTQWYRYQRSRTVKDC